ncbi:ABC transporter [Bacillus subtilis]|uniref:ABC transporter n=1 Tax=Bacillus subtilis TaxID=1423 RepID=UPI002E1F57FE|nr:ABC transporter [Bacillus subtilis]
MYCTEESVGSNGSAKKQLISTQAGIRSMRAGFLHSLRGTVAISELTVQDAELMAIVGFSVSWRTTPQTGLHAMLPVAEQNNGLPSGI